MTKEDTVKFGGICICMYHDTSNNSVLWYSAANTGPRNRSAILIKSCKYQGHLSGYHHFQIFTVAIMTWSTVT